MIIMAAVVVVVVVVVTKPWEPEMRHVSQDLTGGVRCTKQMRHRKCCTESCCVGVSPWPARQARQTQLARVLSTLAVFRPRVTEKVRRGKFHSGVLEGLCHVHRRGMTNLLNLARADEIWQPGFGVVVITVPQVPV